MPKFEIPIDVNIADENGVVYKRVAVTRIIEAATEDDAYKILNALIAGLINQVEFDAGLTYKILPPDSGTEQ